MSPEICQHSAPIRISRGEQRTQPVVKADDKNRRAERLQIFRHEAHPKLFARPDDENGSEQNDEIASRTEEICATCSEAGQNDAIASPMQKICAACNKARQNDALALPPEKIREAYDEAADAVHALLLPQPLRLFNLRIWSAAIFDVDLSS